MIYVFPTICVKGKFLKTIEKFSTVINMVFNTAFAVDMQGGNASCGPVADRHREARTVEAVSHPQSGPSDCP